MTTISEALVQWALAERPIQMRDTDALDLRTIAARYLALRALQRECGHDGMKQVGADLWHCMACGCLQRARDPRGLNMPGTFYEAEAPAESPAEAIGVALTEWTPPPGVVGIGEHNL
jgi:hypothetical protein